MMRSQTNLSLWLLLYFRLTIGSSHGHDDAISIPEAQTSSKLPLQLPHRWMQDNNDDEGQQQEYYQEISSGRILKAKCHAFTIQSDIDNQLSAMLQWSDIKLFHVAQQSYTFFEYHDSNGSEDENYSADQSLMMNLSTWMDNMVYLKGGSITPNCTRIYNPQQYMVDRSQTLQAYLDIDVNTYMAETGVYIEQSNNNYDDYSNYDDDQYDYGNSLPLYQGPICGMGSDTKRINVGVFLDAQCSIFVPTFTYDYRKNGISNSSNVNDTALQEQLQAIDLMAYQTKKTISCKKYPICGKLMAESVNTNYCDEQGSRNRRQLEEDNNNQDMREAQEGHPSNEEGPNHSNGDIVHAYQRLLRKFVATYQLSQYDLYDMSSTCHAAVSALNTGHTLESYLIRHGQLRDPKLLDRWAKFISLVFLVLLLLTWCCCCFRIRRVKKSKSIATEDSIFNILKNDADYDESVIGTINSGSVAGTLLSDSDTFVSGYTEEGTMTFVSGYTEDGTRTFFSAVTNEGSTSDGSSESDSSGSYTCGSKDTIADQTAAPTSQEIQKSRSWLTNPLQRIRTKTPGDLRLPIVTTDDEGVVEFDFQRMTTPSTTNKGRLVGLFAKPRTDS
jgi:hypothetical protein